MLRRLQIHTTAKAGLAGVFCCAFITIAFDITRAVETYRNRGAVGSTVLWTNLESAVAVIVSCLPSFVALIGPKRNRNFDGNRVPYRQRPLAVSDSARLYLNCEKESKSGAQTPASVVKGAGHNGSSEATFRWKSTFLTDLLLSESQLANCQTRCI